LKEKGFEEGEGIVLHESSACDDKCCCILGFRSHGTKRHGRIRKDLKEDWILDCRSRPLSTPSGAFYPKEPEGLRIKSQMHRNHKSLRNKIIGEYHSL